MWMAADFATKRKEHLTRHTRTRHATQSVTDTLEPTIEPRSDDSVVAPPVTMGPTACAAKVKDPVKVKMEPRDEGGGL